ncbi:MAG: peptidylprolyl isomerase [Prevotella sp.]|nr:peptidylprolyl isomerase [Prevotella sp.]
MKKIHLAFLLSLVSLALPAQNADPVVMHINGKPVTRSEFEYSYNKNNSDGVIDKKTVKDYVPLFVAYKLKVEAALDAKLDTTASFKREFASYRDQQIRPAMINDADVEAFARKIYKETQERIDSTGGMVQVAHILILTPKGATDKQQKAAKAKIDSLYNVLKKGADFAAIAKKYSEDPGSAKNGGELPWIVKGNTVKEFENTAWALKDGEMSKPFASPYGWHIILKKAHRNFYDYASQRDDIYRFINGRNLREQIINQKLDSIAKAQQTTPAKVLEAKKLEMELKDPSLKYLIQEYHDGLLLYDMANRTVWEKAQKDSVGQENYFKSHKAKYNWTEPRFKGIAYCARQQADIQRVKDALKDVPFNKWVDVLRNTFNNDSVLRIRAEKGIFTEGMNAQVDKEVFGKDTIAKPVKDYPYTAVYGRKLSAPENVDDVRSEVVADYQEEMEKQWVNALRKRYKVKVDESVLKTVNNH